MDEDRLIQVTNPSDGQSLCRTCYWVHMQKGYRESEEAVFCNYGWRLRRVPFKVCDCTDYQNRTMPNRKEMEDIALIKIGRASGRERVKEAGVRAPQREQI